MKKGLVIKITFLFLVCLFLPSFLSAQKDSPYPKLANYFLKWEISEQEAQELAKWDLLVLDMEVQENSPQQLAKIRKLNPDITILAYITSEEANPSIVSSGFGAYAPLRQKLVQGINDSWWLQDPQGNRISFWEGTNVLNVNTDWSDYLANFVNDNIISTGNWDGVFYDNLWGTIEWLNNGQIDIDNDGLIDSDSKLNSNWSKGVTKLLQTSRQKMKQAIIIGNGTVHWPYQKYINGMMFEGFPSPWENGGTWSGSMQSYAKLMDSNQEPQASIINIYRKNQYDYAQMRFGLASASLQEGYSSFDYDISDHGQIWWYDEYDTNLGSAQSQAYNLLNRYDGNYDAGLWRRDFDNGIIVLNSTNRDQKYVFSKEEFERLNGQQDRSINNGSIVNWVKLEPKDAIILLKRKTLIKDNSFSNGSFVRVFNREGAQTRNGFFSYYDNYPGSSELILSDIDNDGVNEHLVNSGGLINIYKNGSLINSFQPYDGQFRGELSLAVADLNGDGTKEIITGAGIGGGPHVRIFSKDGNPLTGGFFAYDASFRGGVNVAVIDLNGDGTKEIITGAGIGGGPHVRVFSKDGDPLTGGFFAYEESFHGGVNVTVGDVNGDGQKEIITAQGQQGDGEIKIWTKDGSLDNSFFAYQDFTGSINVMANDLDGDQVDEILTASLEF